MLNITYNFITGPQRYDCLDDVNDDEACEEAPDENACGSNHLTSQGSV